MFFGLILKESIFVQCSRKILIFIHSLKQVNKSGLNQTIKTTYCNLTNPNEVVQSIVLFLNKNWGFEEIDRKNISRYLLSSHNLGRTLSLHVSIGE